MNQNNYLVATIKPWNIKRFHLEKQSLPGKWHLVTEPKQLTIDYVENIKPHYIFFPHWSHKVPEVIVNRYECVCFHETDLPAGRGGSPIQNLIENGYDETLISALRMTTDIDAGPIYMKRKLSLLGLAEEIYLRSAESVFEMIRTIVANEPQPEAQVGEPSYYQRRKPEESLIGKDYLSLKALFDHIRMLDADTYPPAFLEYGNLKIEFTRPALRSNHIEANVIIKMSKSK